MPHLAQASTDARVIHAANTAAHSRLQLKPQPDADRFDGTLAEQYDDLSVRFMRMSSDRLVCIAARLHAAFGDSGGTIDPVTIKFVPPGPGYLVSLADYGHCFHTLPSPHDILHWLRKHRALLSDPPRPLYPGVWRDPEQSHWWCDFNLLITERRQAFAIAMREGQQAIFDNMRRAVLPVPHPAHRAA